MDSCKHQTKDVQYLMRATRAIIHLGNLQYNIASIRKKLPEGTRICVPVKADAYGHGALPVAVAAIRSGATVLAVASIQEGIDLRESGIVAPILSLSLPLPEEILSIIQYEITPLVVDSEFISQVGEVARTMNKIVPVHLKIDTGMGRIGCTPAQAVTLARQIKKEKHLILEGTATHLAAADSTAPEDREYTFQQLSRFDTALEEIRSEGIDPGIVHAANSGAVCQYPQAIYDMVRPGILIYGYPPSRDLDSCMDIKPVMELETRIVSIKKIEKGTSVSYNRTWTAPEDTYIATIPVGYADGLVRHLSPGLKVRIGEENFPIVGKICMDQCMIDIGADPWVQRWDVVTIFGPDSKGASARTLAHLTDTIPYEITCGINKRVPRVYLGDDARSL